MRATSGLPLINCSTSALLRITYAQQPAAVVRHPIKKCPASSSDSQIVVKQIIGATGRASNTFH